MPRCELVDLLFSLLCAPSKHLISIELLSHDVIPIDGAITPVRAVELCIDILIDES